VSTDVTHPEPLALPTDNWPDWLAARVDALLQTTRDALDALKDGTQRSAEDVLQLWNDADIALRAAESISSLLSEVHPDEAVRSLAEQRAQDVDRLATDRGLDRELFEVLDGIDATGLDEQAYRFREHILRDFRRSGVDRADDVRGRLREISERLTVLDQDFSRIIRDDVRSIRVTPAQLSGLPDDYIAAHPVDADGLVTITTDYPDLMPFRTFARDAAARRQLTFEYLNRGWPANDDVLHEMLSLRDEKARILGYRSWPDYDADIKMIGTGAAIAEFIERIADAAEPAGRRDKQLLVDRQRKDDPGAAELTMADVAYYTELIRREEFDVDAQDVRRYFDFGNVRRGLLEVTGRLFGVEYRQVDVPSWHPDVTAYDVVGDGAPRGRIYLDLHPREGKFKHAAQFDIVAGISGRQLPEGALVCNLPRGLMEHQHVVTLFHEFGHLVHHILGGDRPGSPAWPPSGTSSRLRRRCSRNGHGTPRCCRPLPSIRTARRFRPNSSQACAPRRSSARGSSSAPRSSTRRSLTCCTATCRPITPPRSCRHSGVTTSSTTWTARTSRPPSVTCPATRRRTTPISGAW
jgi:thimet oligopeptidase